MMLATSTIPDNTGYVLAAYLVFLALVLVYVAIMATRLGRLERELVELTTPQEEEPDPDEAGLVGVAPERDRAAP